MSAYTPLGNQNDQTPRLGTSGDTVKAAQTAYNQANPNATQLKVDGFYGPLTDAALNPKTSSSSLINTSTQSKTNYNNNVTTLNGANASLTTGGNTGTSKLPAPGMQTAVYDTTGALKGYTQSDGSFVDVGGKSSINPSATNTAPKAGLQEDGSTIIQNDDGTSYTLPAGVDPSVGKMMNDNLVQANKDIANYKTIADNAQILYASDVAGTNPAALAAAADIQASFDVLINQMKDKNKMLLGSYSKNSARTGMLQYANEMDTNFKSEAMDRATARIADLTAKAKAAILKSNQAYASGDLKAFQEATKTYADAKKEGQTQLVNLQTTINNAIKNNQADIKIAAKAENDRISNDIKTSNALATEMARVIEDNGIKDEKTIDEYVQAMAERNGVTDPSVLKSAFTKAQQAETGFDYKILNIQSQIKKRNNPVSPKNPGSTTYKNFTNKPTAATITKVNSYIQSIGGNQAAIDKANSDESLFYKTLNAIPATTKKQGS